jgi:hypothetical protein
VPAPPATRPVRFGWSRTPKRRDPPEGSQRERPSRRPLAPPPDRARSWRGVAVGVLVCCRPAFRTGPPPLSWSRLWRFSHSSPRITLSACPWTTCPGKRSNDRTRLYGLTGVQPSSPRDVHRCVPLAVRAVLGCAFPSGDSREGRADGDMSRFRKLAAGVALVIAGVTIPIGAATAGPGGTKGPGDCAESPGSVFSVTAEAAGFSNAGPNSFSGWALPPAPNAPGQAVKAVCFP